MNRSNQPMFYGAYGITFKKARDLRKRMTDAEKLLWNCISKKQRKGYRFRRQHPIRKFIADFYCHEASLAIEVDGGIHFTKTQKEYDVKRDAVFSELGITVLRFTNDEIYFSIESVITKIEKELSTRKIKVTTPSPL